MHLKKSYIWDRWLYTWKDKKKDFINRWFFRGKLWWWKDSLFSNSKNQVKKAFFRLVRNKQKYYWWWKLTWEIVFILSSI